MVVNKINTRPPAYYYQFVWDTSKSGVSADNSGTFWVGRPPYIPDSRVVTSRSHAYKSGLGATYNFLYKFRCKDTFSDLIRYSTADRVILPQNFQPSKRTPILYRGLSIATIETERTQIHAEISIKL